MVKGPFSSLIIFRYLLDMKATSYYIVFELLSRNIKQTWLLGICFLLKSTATHALLLKRKTQLYGMFVSPMCYVVYKVMYVYVCLWLPSFN